MMRLRSTTHSTDQHQRSAAGSPSSITNWCVAEEWTGTLRSQCVLLVHFEGFTHVRDSPSVSAPAELRWTHSKIQCFFMCGRRLQDVAASLQQGVEQPSELPVIGIVKHEMKLYSRNNRRLWCFKEAKVEAVEVCISSVDTAFLHGLTLQTDGLSVTFFPHSAVQGVCQRVRQPKAQIVQPQMCQRGRASAAVASDEINNCHSCHMKSRVQLWQWQLRPLAPPCASQPARDRRAPTRVPHITFVFIITARGSRNWRACGSRGSEIIFDRKPFFIIFYRLLYLI